MTTEPITRADDDLNAGLRAGTLTRTGCPYCEGGCPVCHWEGSLYVSAERVYRAPGGNAKKHYDVEDVSF